MLRRIIFLVLILALLALVPAVAAQTSTDETPIYVRYCTAEEFTLALNAIGTVEAQLTTLNELLVRYDSGSLAAPEGTSSARELLTLWTNTEQLDCLAPFNRDMQQAISDFLIGMLYWQLEQTTERDFYLQNARNTLINLNSRRNAAVAYLENPPAPEEEASGDSSAVEPTLESPTAAPTDLVLRDGITLRDLLTGALVDRGITLLRPDDTSVTVSALSNSGVILIAIDTLPDFDDRANVLFTFDVLAELIADWPELPLFTGITVDVYDADGAIVLSITSTGENFRAYYYDETLTQEQFEAGLVVSE